MKLRTTIAAAAALAIAGSATFLPGAAQAGDTSVTFEVDSGSLSISVPSAATIGGSSLTDALAGATVTGTLGSTTVSDTRGALAAAAWTITASMANDFVHSGGTATIAKGQASMYSGLATATSGIVTFTGTTAVNPVTMSTTGGALGSATLASGSHSVTYDPTLSISIPGNATPGSYTGSVTQTVA